MRSIKFLKVYFWFTLIISVILSVSSFKHTMFYHFFIKNFGMSSKDLERVPIPIDTGIAMSIIFDILLTVALPITLIWIPYVIISYMRNRRSK